MCLASLGVQLMVAYSWARPVTLAAGEVEGECFISSVSFLSFIFLLLHCPSISPSI